ncbi:MAG: response regulator [Anaerolineae bacterium]|jgi:DNA-binding NarL/FixJ family response regulator
MAARALIVEDDRSWQQILSELLADAGLEVDVESSLEGAIACLRSRVHRLAVVDLALGDGDVGNQDGLRVLDAIRQQDPGCVAIMLTGYATVEIAVSALTAHGAYTCLRKEDFRRTEFRALVHEALASTPPVSSERAGEMADSSSQDERRSTDAGPVEGATLGSALVVEDDAAWRSILSELVTDAGYQVRACRSYGEALGCLRREKYALAILDLSLSDSLMHRQDEQGLSGVELEGYRLLAEARETGVPTVVVSGISAPEEVERAYAERDVLAYLAKQTFDRGAFLQAIGDVRSASALGSELEQLTPREREVLELLAQGMTNKGIAETLVITTNTVKRHLKAVFSKLEVHTRAAAAAKAIQAGIPAEPLTSDEG